MAPRKVYILFLLILFRTQLCYSAYTTPIPDANFVAFLSTAYPGLMSGSMMDTIVAAGKTGTLNCRAKSISNIYGIQFFKQLSIININSNSITSIPTLKNFVNLQSLFCDSNALSSLPALNTIPTLQVFSCRKNNLTSLPSLSGLINLNYLSCSLNNITSLPSFNGLGNLTTLDVSENKLTQLTNLDSQINLKNLYCSTNFITALPSLSNLTKLQLLYCGNNLLTSLPDLSNCTVLNTLRITTNNITNLPSLPFTAAPMQVYLDYNNLTFEDLLPVVNNTYYSTPIFKLFPQNNFGIYADTLVKETGTFNFNLLIDASLGITNTYKWYRNGTYLYSSNTNSFSITTILFPDTGNYYAVVYNSNPKFSGDSLISNVKKLKEAVCFSGTGLSYSYTSVSCNEGFRIMIDASAISGGATPYTYILTNLSNGDKITSSSTTLSGIKEGDYSLIMKDAANCETPALFCQFVSGTNCDPVFSPNGDGVVDTYFISTPGKARIFDKSGTLINEINTPAYWDGLDKSGAEVPSGYYAIIVNEKTTTNVSLMR
jgi:internalin A